MKEYIKPQSRPSSMDDSISSHPAFASIRADRIQGSVGYLYGSDFKHDGAIRIRISMSELHRGLSRDWHADGKAFIEVELSYAQWARFISNQNADSTPCTLNWHGEEIPGIAPVEEKRTEQFGREMKETLADAHAAVQRIRAMYAEGNPGKKAVLAELIQIENNLAPNVSFVADQFGRHMEKTVEQAKVEVHAHALGVVQRMGLEALGIAPSIEFRDEDAT